MSIIKVVAFDPGITTGIASGIVDTEIGSMLVNSDQQKWTVAELFEYLETTAPQVVVFETFEFRQKARRGLVLFSKELIGVIELYAARHTDVQVCRQNAAQAKTYYTDNRLKTSFTYKIGKGHANDAMRHLLRWFEFGPGYKYNKKGYEPA